MRWLIRLFNQAWSWVFGNLSRYEGVWVEDVPEKMQRKKVYLAGENGHLWYAALLCPCGCGSVLQMGLMEGQRPKWSVLMHDDGTVSLHPSVWRKVGCRSHFWLKEGCIVWCDNQK